MRVEQLQWQRAGGWQGQGGELDASVNLVLVFGSRACLDEARYQELASRYPDACLMGCTTAGEICNALVSDDSIVASAVAFADTTVILAQTDIAPGGDSRAAGQDLAGQLPAEGLIHVFVLSDGLLVNGTDLVAGLRANLPPGVEITGGLAGDGTAFAETRVIANAPPRTGCIAALGFYGPSLKVGYGSLGGWDTFGPDRLITRSQGNVLYELDGQPALDLYKRYLGEYAAGLPASGLLFPLALRAPDGHSAGLVRTILAVDEQVGSMTFAGDIPQGAHARLMKANFERLIDGAAGAAEASRTGLHGGKAELALLISCVGRKLVLQQRVEEEVECVRQVLGPDPAMCGFYSYGEISPFQPTARCELHNQTMTITTFAEA
ncbi:MAG: FIST C-terminal domain-containing protein [Betaproteobacteria bacterium]|nr:FIST C-terminal domain-containing protein [Betaproteobacteria bacterium]